MCLQLCIFWDTWPKNIYINGSVFCFLGVFLRKGKINIHSKKKKKKKKKKWCFVTGSVKEFIVIHCFIFKGLLLQKKQLILSWSWFELAFICFCVLACQRTAVGIRRGRNRGRAPAFTEQRLIDRTSHRWNRRGTRSHVRFASTSVWLLSP